VSPEGTVVKTLDQLRDYWLVLIFVET